MRQCRLHGRSDLWREEDARHEILFTQCVRQRIQNKIIVFNLFPHSWILVLVFLLSRYNSRNTFELCIRRGNSQVRRNINWNWAQPADLEIQTVSKVIRDTQTVKNGFIRNMLSTTCNILPTAIQSRVLSVGFIQLSTIWGEQFDFDCSLYDKTRHCCLRVRVYLSYNLFLRNIITY